MAHLSLYRKFRPDTFDKMVRQEHVVRVLKNQIASNAVGHAYLFCGPRGTGKTSVARIFARAVNCEHPADGSPCGTCEVCRALAAGTLDISEIDAASNNGVNEMRDLREKVQYPPVSGRYKVYIIDEVHMLTDSAFNALLKTLEEPPAHVIFILATTEPHRIPATILSRCMRLDFKLIPESDLEAHLTRILEEIGKPYEKEAVSAIARAGAGSDRDMLSIAEMCLAYSEKLTYEGVTAVLGAADFRETGALVNALLQGDTGASLAATEKILSEGKSVGVLCRDILQLLNQIAVAKTCKDAEKLLSLPKKLFAQVAEIAARAEGRSVLRATEIFVRLETELRFASSPRISLETAIVRVSTPAVDCDVDALLVRIAALEKRLAEGVPAVAAEKSEAKPTVAAEPAPRPLREEEPQSFAAEEPFPMEEPVFAEAYFADEPPVREGASGEKTAPAVSTAAPTPFAAHAPERGAATEPSPFAPSAPKASVVAPSGEMTAEMAFGKFLRTLRKTSRNGVLFTMCADLEARFEGGKLVLETDIETVCRSLAREDHRAVMAEVFAQIGIADFEVRPKKKGVQDNRQGVEALRRDFSEYPIEVK